MYDVITVGSAFLDILVKSRSFKLLPSKEFSEGIALCEAYGGKVEADEIELASGGGGTNNAVSFARKGLKTTVIAEMGVDPAGKMIQAELLREKVDTDFLVVEEGEQTGISVILISGEDAGRSVVSYRGASRMLTHKDIPWKKMKTKWLHISSLGGRISLMEELVSWAKNNSVKVSINPGKAELKEKSRMEKIIDNIEVLLLNREEAAYFTGNDYMSEEIYRAKSCIAGSKISVITSGKDGGKVCVGGKCSFYSTVDVKKASTLGAGDAFGSGFVAALIHGKEMDTAIEWGRKNARSVLKYLSAKEGLLRLSELN